MNKDKIKQEQLCLQTKYLIDQLRTNLFMIDDFNSSVFESYDKKLKCLKNIINDIYWNI